MPRAMAGAWQARRERARSPEEGRRQEPTGGREAWKPEWGETGAARLDAQRDRPARSVSVGTCPRV